MTYDAGNSTSAAKKQYGQNFLTDPAIPARIVAGSGITAEHGVIEIGPGRGILTEQLSRVAKKVIAVEIDRDLIPVLSAKFADRDNVTVIEGDILETDISALIKRYFPEMPVAVCANIPYYITTPIITKLLENAALFDSATLLVQKEVAERLTSRKGSADYSSFTAFCSYYATVKKLFGVPAGCFTPKPKVNSAVIRFDMRTEPPVTPESTELFFSVIRAAFAYRRKTFANCLCASVCSDLPKEAVASLLVSAGFPPSVRGEQLDIYDFAAVSDLICSVRRNAGKENQSV